MSIWVELQPLMTIMRGRLRNLRDRFPVAAIGIEVFLIVLAVLLALTVDQWRDERNNQQLAEAALISVRHEVQNNRRLLEDRHPYHVAVRDSLRKFTGSSTEDIQRIGRSVFPRGGRFFDLSSTAYRTAQSSGALAYIDFDLLFILMAIYEAQESLEDFDAGVTATLFDPQHVQPGTLPYTIGLAADLMSDVLGTEKELLPLYDRFLEMTRSLPAAPIPADSRPSDTTPAVQP